MTDTKKTDYDVIIIGSGAAGYTAALYAVRYKLKTLVIGLQDGGQSALAHDIENYPGFVSIKGPELMKKFKESAVEYGTETKMDEVNKIEKNEDNTYSINLTYSGEKLTATTVLLALGTKNRKLGAIGEDKFYGKGVTYCATCDGMFFKEKIVGIVGAGDSAVTAAIYMAELCPKVYLFVRKDQMRAEPIWKEKLLAKTNIEVVYNTSIKEFAGDKKLEKVISTDGKEFILDGCFIEIGADPNTALLDSFKIEKDKGGYIVVDKEQAIPNNAGLFSAGDVTTGSNHFHQIATAVGEGAVSANSMFNYIQKF
ncbi:TPA: FAD-dependent oxidoreductase [Candidatus Gracilibacteria bacterium]|nr:FAD-binding protein [Candidatus Peregrinibacteria bacterium]HIQ56913.1 FAD-dependent oxidoreductase [Candidatus Gracilibacteria bacterium]HIQ57318.1 FAD-dependent oxidoreductase [Candidatus Gracilibacteria bacterium]